MDNGLNKLREFDGFRLDLEKRVLWYENTPVNLQLKEIEILSVLTERPGDVITKKELMDRVWAESFVEESNLSRHIYRLRKAFMQLGADGEFIQTVPRRGYRFSRPVGVLAPGDLIIERHSRTQTLIEEIHASEEPDELRISLSASRRTNRFRMFTISSIVLLGALAVAGFFAYNRTAANTAPIRSIAVLPFRSVDPNEASHRGLGIADLLITRLSNIKEINVRPTSAVMEYDAQNYDLSSIREKLQVDAALEGTIVSVGGQVRVTARLVRLSDNSSIWAAQFVKNAESEAELQDEIALQVVDALAINLTNATKTALTKRYTESEDAIQLYQRGRYHWNKRSNEGLVEAQRLFRNAVDKDPNFALAYVGIADTLIFAPVLGEAATAVEKALMLDPNLAEAYATRGFINMIHKWEWDSAEADFKKSIDLNPGYPTAQQWYANLLMIRGRPAEAQSLLRRAFKVDPLSYNILSDLCQADYYARDFDTAIEDCRKALNLNPDFQYAHGNLAQIYFQTQRYEDALRENAIALAILSRHPAESSDIQTRSGEYFDELDSVFRRDGIRGYWQHFISESSKLRSKDTGTQIGLARAHLGLDEREAALQNLEIAVNERAFLAPFINADPAFDPLRSDPRFQAIIERMGLN